MMWWNHGAWGAGDWFAMSLMMIAFWGLLGVLIVWMVRNRRNGDGRTAGLGTRSVTAPALADEVLSERFARGEIDADEFARRRTLLHDNPSRS